MGTKAVEIMGVEPKEIVALLNKALADEWLAYYQYWIGAKVAKGKMRPAVVAELEEHASDELRHAGMLVERINTLGGTPLIDPKTFEAESNCGYDAPVNPNTLELLKQNIKGEQCAIEVYNKLLIATKDKDVITHHVVLEILKDEVEHEEDLQAMLEDLGQ